MNANDQPRKMFGQRFALKAFELIDRAGAARERLGHRVENFFFVKVGGWMFAPLEEPPAQVARTEKPESEKKI